MPVPTPIRISSAQRALLSRALGLVPGAALLDVTGGATGGESAGEWDCLVNYAREHFVLPALGRTILESPLRGSVPAGAREVAEEAAIHNEVQNRVLLADLAEAVSALRDVGIATIALKGAGLLARYPRLLRIRHTDDIDLWVEPGRARAAERVLRARGYRDLEKSQATRPVSYDGRARQPRTHDNHHDLPPLLSERGTPLEIHHRPATDGRSRAWSDALGAIEQVEIDGVVITMRDPPSMLRDLCAHVVVHHAAAPALRIRHLIDVATLLDEDPYRSTLAADGARFEERMALSMSVALLSQLRESGGDGDGLASRLLFSTAESVGWVRALERAVAELQTGPRAWASALWPSEEFLRARGYADGPLWRARWERARDVITQACS